MLLLIHCLLLFPFLRLCVCSLLCYEIHCALSSFAIILIGKGELVALLKLSSWWHVTMGWSEMCDCGISRSYLSKVKLLSELLPAELGGDFWISNCCSGSIHIEFYTRDNYIWTLLNEALASLIKFIWNNHECKILFIIWPFKCG